MPQGTPFDEIVIPDADFEKYTKFLQDTHNVDFHRKRARVLGYDPASTMLSPGAQVDRKHVTVGKNVLFAYYCYVSGDVTVEDNVLIGPHCAIAAGNHKFDPKTKAFTARDWMDKDVSIVIGAGSWLAHGVTVTGGVRVGKGNLICAGAVVTKSTPDFAIMAGVPARQVGHIDPETGEYIWYSRQSKED